MSTSERMWLDRPIRKRTKTFTGCWTCRRRKIKCDERRPYCKQCFERRLSCEGYEARLQWLTPETNRPSNAVLGARPEQSEPSARSISLRRCMDPAHPAFVLTSTDVDEILRLIDSLERDNSESPATSDISVQIEAFGVFGHRPTTFVSQRTYEPTITATTTAIPTPSGALTRRSPFTTLEEASPTLTHPAWDGTSPQYALDSDHQHNADFTTTALPRGLESWDDDPLSLPVTSSPEEDASLVSAVERYLLHYYMTTVVHLFCVIDNAKSPWRTIHLPIVLQTIGGLSITSTATRVRGALKSVVLSISAFCLANSYQARDRHNDAAQWTEVAMRYRGDAIGLLKQAVEVELNSSERPKYKDFLATMLSMITANVMSGDTSTCGVHLSGIDQLIHDIAKYKLRFSHKAQALHRIYFYLKIIYESTSVNTPAGSNRFSPLLDRGSGLHTSTSPHQQQELNLFSAKSATTMWSNQIPDMATFECIYGIPESLLRLLKSTISVIDYVEASTMQDISDIQVPRDLDRICDDLEKEIFEWSVDEELDPSYKTLQRDFEIISHQTRAFYNAVVIYFSQNIRSIKYRYLQHNVEAILDSIEAIELVKIDSRILRAPLFWPAFIGATEAFEPRHQDRFREWYKKVNGYGLEAVRTGIQVVNEVWKLGPSSSRSRRSTWREIVHDTNTILMLS